MSFGVFLAHEDEDKNSLYTCCSCSCVFDRSEVSWSHLTSSWERWALNLGQSDSLRWRSWVACFDTDTRRSDMASISMEKSWRMRLRKHVYCSIYTFWIANQALISVSSLLQLWVCHVSFYFHFCHLGKWLGTFGDLVMVVIDAHVLNSANPDYDCTSTQF